MQRDRSERRVAVVTGVGRRRGIATSVARELARQGWSLLLTYWGPYGKEVPLPEGPRDAADVAHELESFGVGVALCEEDLADPDGATRVMDAAEREFGAGSVVALANVAAHSERGSVMQVSPADFDRHMNVNARGTLLLSQEFARRFKGPWGSGRIVNFTSGLPLEDEIAYAASKGAIEAISQSCALELANLGITVNCLDPGPNDTGWMSPEFLELCATRIPLGRAGTPGDVAPLVAFLCSSAGGWVTGQILHCDGGWSLVC